MTPVTTETIRARLLQAVGIMSEHTSLYQADEKKLKSLLAELLFDIGFFAASQPTIILKVAEPPRDQRGRFIAPSGEER